jgi:hypothetical protein
MMNMHAFKRRLLASMSWLVLVAPCEGQSLLWDRISPPALQAGFGGTMWPISDVNGDQVRDLLIGAPLLASYFGILSGDTGNTIAEFFTPLNEGLRPVGTVGDVNGDGKIDFMIMYWPGGGCCPITDILSGLDGTLVDTLNGGVDFPLGIGDVNGDGFGDFAIGTPLFSGSVAVYHGPGFNFAYGIPAQWNFSTFGRALARCGDIDGDGKPEFIVGAPGILPGSPTPPVVPGYAYVFSGANGAMLHNWAGPFVTSKFGEAVVSPGDVNGDGVPDIVVSAPSALTLSCFSGANGAQIGSYTDVTGVVGWFGNKLEALGDVDGDGVGDFAATGTWVEVFSGASMTPIYRMTTTLPMGFLQFGMLPRTFTPLDDFDGDDFPEVVIGATAAAGNQPGHVQCYTLRPPGVTVVGAACPQSNGTVARIGATGVAKPNSTYNLNLSRVPSGLGSALIIGLSNTHAGNIPLPLVIDPVLAPGCVLYESIDWFLPTPTVSASPGTGRAIVPLSIPPGVTGLTFYTQWAIENPAGSPTLGSVTRSLAITIQ